MVPRRRDKNLGLVLEPPESLGMDDPVAVALKSGAVRTFLLGSLPSPGVGR